jgi:riboflavin kinase/FMN adenylyltransferase
VFSATGRWTPAAPACVVSVGNFDGVHLGHATIARRLVDRANALGLPAVAVTFHPHPAAILRPGEAPAALTTPRRRAELLVALGVDAVIVQPADRRLLRQEAEAFYTDMLRGRLGACSLVEGTDFHFGAGRRGDVALLGRLCAADHVDLEVVPPVLHDGAPVSSSRLRRLLAAGDIAAANRMLTAPYRITGRVVEGAKRGRTLGFPTANLAAIATLLPAGGVYAARAHLTTGDGGPAVWPAAVHVGPSVSFGATEIAVEVHLIGFRGDLYGTTLHVDFLERLRDTRRFSAVPELVAQLTSDTGRAAEVVAAAGPPASPEGA